MRYRSITLCAWLTCSVIFWMSDVGSTALRFVTLPTCSEKLVSVVISSSCAHRRPPIKTRVEARATISKANALASGTAAAVANCRSATWRHSSVMQPM
eukprot:2753591-Prymnesium_polylepis.1